MSTLKALDANESSAIHGSCTVGHGVAAVTGYHPALVPLGRFETRHWVEVDGVPVGAMGTAIDMYPSRHGAVFAAKCIARRIARSSR